MCIPVRTGLAALAFDLPVAVYLRDDRGPIFGFAAPTRFFLLQSQTFFRSGHGAIYHRRRKKGTGSIVV